MISPCPWMIFPCSVLWVLPQTRRHLQLKLSCWGGGRGQQSSTNIKSTEGKGGYTGTDKQMSCFEPVASMDMIESPPHCYHQIHTGRAEYGVFRGASSRNTELINFTRKSGIPRRSHRNALSLPTEEGSICRLRIDNEPNRVHKNAFHAAHHP